MGRRAASPGPAWGPPGRRGSWRAALLAAYILNPHVLLTQASIWTEREILITWEPSQPQTGDNLTLTPGGAPKRLLSCSWYQGWTTAKEKKIISSSLFGVIRHKEGLSHTGRETAGPNCSLHIRNLRALDSGNYTVTKKGFFSLEIGHAYVEVSDSSLLKLSPGIVSGIILGLLLAVTAAIIAFLYFSPCGQNQGSWGGTQPSGPILAPAQPVSNLYQSNKMSTEALSTYSAYEYVYPSAQVELQTQVKSGNCFDTSQGYQTLQVQCGSQDVYHDLRKPHPPPPGSSSWPYIPS